VCRLTPLPGSSTTSRRSSAGSEERRYASSLADDGLSPEDIDDLLEGVRSPRALRAAIDWYRAGFWDGVRGRLPRAKVDVPTLAIWGDKEQHLNAPLADPPADWASSVRVVHLPEASHWVHHDAPDKVAALLIEHFAGAAAGETRAASVGDRANGAT
jgi:pimeloyl-ACP methyl ester carboxylesterase